MRSTQIKACFEIGFVEPFNGGVKRQHHEGQIDIDQPRNHRAVIIEELQRLKGKGTAREQSVKEVPCATECLVHKAIGTENRHQRIGADEQIDPEGQNGDEQQDRLPTRGRKADGEGDGVSEDQADKGGNGADPDRFPHDLEIDGIDRAQIIERGAGDLNIRDAGFGAEAVNPQNRKRGREEQSQPKGSGQRQQPEQETVIAPTFQDASARMKTAPVS